MLPGIDGLIGMFGGGAITLVGSAQFATLSSNNTALTLNQDTGVQVGDLLIAVTKSQSTNTWIGDTGWTEPASADSGGLRIAWKIATVAGAQSYVFTQSGSTKGVGFIVAYRNAAFDVVGTITTTTGTTETAGAITLSQGDSTIVGVWSGSTAGITWGSQTAGLVSLGSNNAQAVGMAAFSQDHVASGSTGTKQATASSNPSNPAYVLIGIKAA